MAIAGSIPTPACNPYYDAEQQQHAIIDGCGERDGSEDNEGGARTPRSDGAVIVFPIMAAAFIIR